MVTPLDHLSMHFMGYRRGKFWGYRSASEAEWLDSVLQSICWKLEKRFDSLAAFVVVGINVKHTNRIAWKKKKTQTETSFTALLIIIIFYEVWAYSSNSSLCALF